MSDIPWYNVLGNHDWKGKDVKAQIEYSKVNELWNIPSFNYDFTIDLGPFGKASFYFIDTSLLVYGYNGERSSGSKKMPLHFAEYVSLPYIFRQGWTEENDSINTQLNAIQERLSADESEYIFVSGHHPTSFCATKNEERYFTFVSYAIK